jgi:hypothetical protein
MYASLNVTNIRVTNQGRRSGRGIFYVWRRRKFVQGFGWRAIKKKGLLED